MLLNLVIISKRFLNSIELNVDPNTASKKTVV